MKKRLIIVLSFVQCTISGIAQALQSNIVYTDNNVRFTVISDGVVRMEYEPDGNYINDKSFVAVQRKYPQCAYSVKEKGQWIEIITSKMKIRYRKGSGSFSNKNLTISSMKGVKKFEWKPGMKQVCNLKGTYRTLDGYDGDSRGDTGKMPIEDGLLAKDGWTLLDDSKGFLFDNSDWEWVKERPKKNGQDWYFLAYGNDYKSALKDFTLFSGKVPLPPRFVFGYWWSRYWSYSDRELHDLVNNFKAYGIPLDVLVIDMDWHYTEKGRGGWTGWTWNRRLFPNPEQLIKDLHKEQLKVTLNLHPADGIAAYEEQYPLVARDMGIDPTSKRTIPWVNSDKHFINAVFKDILTPMEKWGVDFWWLDWQQALGDPKMKDLSNTWWINYSFFTHMERNRDTRPLLYHRWGGLGNHRYQVGFSGDAVISWKSLDFQPYFNSTASNVLYGYWSHDIGGHYGANKIDPEMYTRWLQFGALSPVMRTHSSKDAGLNKEPWVFDKEHLEVIRRTIRERYELVPYIYTMARKDYDEALSLCRPMYYDYPDCQEAYDFRNEYMFGDDLLVAPVTSPMKNGYSTVKIWLPAGTDWYEWQTGTMLKGGQTLERSFALDEYPVYAKAGSVIPMYTDKVMKLNCNDEDIVVTVFPGKQGTFSLYEDNGNDKKYDKEYARTLLTAKKEGNLQAITIGKRLGHYADMPESRVFKIRVVNALPPRSVTMDGKPVEFSYSGNDFSIYLNVPETACSKEKSIQIVYPSTDTTVPDGLYGYTKRMAKAIEALKYRDAGIVLNNDLGNMGSINAAVEYYPEKASTLINRFMENYRNLPEVLKKQGISDDNQKWFLQFVGWHR